MPDDEEIWVFADPNHLKKVLLNLLTNAIKYNRDNGDIEISINLDIPDTARLKISDTGFGVSEEKQNQIFKPFNAITPNQSFKEGVGLGLSISKLLMEMMKGKIYFESQPDKGSSFFIELPIAKRESISSEQLENKFSGIRCLNKSIEEEIKQEIDLSEISLQEDLRTAFLEAAKIYNYTQMEKLTKILISLGSEEKLMGKLIEKHLQQYDIEKIINILNKTKQASPKSDV